MTFSKSISTLGLIFVFFLFSFVMTAQDQTPRATSVEAMANQLTRYEVDQLKLDAREAKDLKKINMIYAESLLDLRKKAGKENTITQERALRRSHNLKIRSILSSKKYQEYLALKQRDAEDEKEN
ncbi:hypothetical protein [Psychroflexus tropicus]|uniref:hypothetical protein n=1 Tax=Psychroflexus tropicus TaxID=197345 RepID=UPI0012F7EF6B|nr:hypothetical protein [Psychroflexus tropicus]